MHTKYRIPARVLAAMPPALITLPVYCTWQTQAEWLLALAEDANRALLEAFYVGRAFAQTVTERLGAALGDFLSEVSKADAERQRALRSAALTHLRS